MSDRDVAYPAPDERDTPSAEAPDLETVMHLMWDRIEALESGRRKMRRAVAAASLVAIAALVVLSARTVGGPSESGPVVLRDLGGRIRARFEVDPQGDRTLLRMFAADGTEQVTLASSSDGPTLTFARGSTAQGLRIGLDTNAPIIDIVGQDGATEHRLVPVGTAPAAAAATPANARESGESAPAAASVAHRPRVREAAARGSLLWFPPQRKSNCQPGTLGCARVSSAKAGSPEG